MARIRLSNTPTTTTPDPGEVSIYAKADNHLYRKDDAGNEVQLLDSSGAAFVLSLNSQTGAVTISSGASGSDVNITQGGGTITINIPTASGTITGKLSAADWATFNGKQNAITGAASTVTTSNLAASRAVVSDASGKIAASATTSSEIGFVSGVTSAIQTQINGKQNTITGAATTITTSNLTASRAVTSDILGKIAVSSTTALELSYVSGVTGAIQSQIDGKQPTGNYITALTGDVTASGPGSVAATLANSGVVAGNYSNPTIDVDAKGRITSITSGAAGGVTSVSNTDGTLTISPTTGAVIASLANTAVTPGSYEILGATVDAQGRLTAAAERKPTVIAMAIIFG